MELISISVKLGQTTCIRGESVYFDVVVANAAKAPIGDFPDLDPQNEAVQLVADNGKEQRAAHQGSYREREGTYRHAEEQRTITLAASQKLSLRDDLLAWFGELAPGKYQITAVYSGRLMEVTSDPVELVVEPAAPLLATTPRIAAQVPAAPLTAAWVHKQVQGALLFYQQQSAILPRTALHAVRAAETKEVKELLAATLAGAAGDKGHVVWVDERGRLMAAAADVRNPRLVVGTEMKPPFKGSPLASPLSLSDGTLLVPFADEKRQRCTVLRLDSSDATQSFELDLGKIKPLGPYGSYWEYARRLHFVWTTARGREVFHARLPLDDLAAGFSTRSAYVSDDPLLWLDAYLDGDTTARGAPYLEELQPPDQRGKVAAVPPPALMLWCVAEAAGTLRCTRVNAASGQATPGSVFTTSGAKDVRVIASAVTFRYDLALLLADGQDRLYYASTPRGTFQPLAAVVGREIALADFPGLLAAGGNARSPWVYLRYVNEKKSIEYIRLEPADEQDPAERARPAARARYATS